MFSVIFEVHPNEGRKDDYLDLARHLKPILEKIDGFVDNERFESKLRPGWVLSHSTWRDEKSVVRWRTEGEHHVAQDKGRFEIFQDYHLRVGDVTSDTAPPKEAPILERRFDETEVGNAKIVTLTEIMPEKGAAFAAQPHLLPAHLGLDPANSDVVEYDVFASIYNAGKLALLVGWKDPKAGNAWSPRKTDGIATHPRPEERPYLALLGNPSNLRLCVNPANVRSGSFAKRIEPEGIPADRGRADTAGYLTS